MLTLLLGTDWIANREEILHMIAEDVSAGKVGRILIVPDFISHEAERRLCMAAGDTTSRYAEVLSFSRLSQRVADFVGHATQECMDNGGRVVAMASAVKQLHSQLKAYASVETKPEFLTGLVDAVDEFKRCCITSSMLSEASAMTEGSLAQKLHELSSSSLLPLLLSFPLALPRPHSSTLAFLCSRTSLRSICPISPRLFPHSSPSS